MRILLIEDDPVIQEFVSETLADEGHQVEPAPDGGIGLARAAVQPPDLILLDMRMPGMDGWAFARAYRALPGPHAPVVVMTAADDAQRSATEVQAAGVLAKPFDLDHLLAVIERHCQAE